MNASPNGSANGSLATSHASDLNSVGPSTQTTIISVAPLTWPGGKIGKCYRNVQEMIARHGGEPVYGWALDYGPCRRSGWYPPPLYRRLLNHVVWRDASGQLWEVTPNADLDHPQQQLFAKTEFLPDAEATFELQPDGEWLARPTRYAAARPEGREVVWLLQQAQEATTEETRLNWITKALDALKQAGFVPTEWKVETIGDRTGAIWLIAE